MTPLVASASAGHVNAGQCDRRRREPRRLLVADVVAVHLHRKVPPSVVVTVASWVPGRLSTPVAQKKVFRFASSKDRCPEPLAPAACTEREADQNGRSTGRGNARHAAHVT